MTARLYQTHPSPGCAAVRKLLEYKGLDYETVEVDFVERGEVLSLSAQLSLPVLRLADEGVVAGTRAIALRLEEAVAEPTILPRPTRGLHLALSHYLETSVDEATAALALPDCLDFYRGQGPLQAAFFERLSEARLGAGSCESVRARPERYLQDAYNILAPFEEALVGKAFLLGQLGLADFMLYGQLFSLTFTGQNKIPIEFNHLRAFYDRLDRLSAALEPQT